MAAIIPPITAALRHLALILVYGMGVLSIVATGGGGGGGDGVEPITYVGNLDAAVITTDNADLLVNNVLGNNDTAFNIVGVQITPAVTTSNPRVSEIANRITHRLVLVYTAATTTQDPKLPQAVIVVDEIEYCDSGSIKYSGTLKDNGTGSISVDFRNCRIDDETMNGRATMRIDAFDLNWFEITDATISFPRLTITGPDYNFGAGGSIRLELFLGTDTERLTVNMAIKDNTSVYMQKTEDLVITMVTDNMVYPPSYTQSLQGRMFDSVHGYVDIVTSEPLGFSSLDQEYPDAGGQAVLTGAADARILVTTVSGTEVNLQLDLDADTNYEYAITMPWDMLGQIRETNSAPTADTGPDRTVSKSSLVLLDGRNSSDSEYDFLNYTWELIQKPSGSSATLDNANVSQPSFTADLVGDYVLQLVVNDGQLDSAPDSVTISAINDAPIAKAGNNFYVGIGTEASLDGSDSSDPNGDNLSYSWSFVSRPPTSTTVLIGETTATPGFNVDVGGLYEVQLIVSDGDKDSLVDTARVLAVENIQNHCTGDDTTGMAPTGSLLVGPSADFIPLCDGQILLGDRLSNQVNLINVASNTIDATYPLSAAPGDLELDLDNGLLYVAQSPATTLTKINLLTGTQAAIPLSAAAVNLALGNEGRIFAVLDDSASWPLRPLAIIDGLGETEEQVTNGDYGELIVYDRFGSQLISGTRGGSPSALSRYSVDETTLAITFGQERNAGSNGQDLAISPDGDHIAYPNGGGNGSGYTIFDFSSDDLDTVYGEWNTGAYPASAAFDPFGEYVVATDTFSIKVFNAETHALVQEYPIDFSNCNYYDLRKVGFSRGGRIVYGFANCGFADDSGKLFWAVFDP